MSNGSEETLAHFIGDREDGGKPSGEAQAMIRSQGQGSHMAKYLVDTNDRTQLMELLMRTVFHNREEMLLFNDYVAWCEDFGISLEHATRYAAARPSVGGIGRNQLVDALTTLKNLSGSPTKHGSNGEKDSRKLPP